jgi:N-methylhydantoinase A/acetophenone carboxylase
LTVTVGVDVGGTFTDICVTRDGRAVRSKSDTTSFDLKVGFFNALDGAASSLGVDADTLLRECESLVYSTTVGTNALIERRGPRLGVITTAGFEDTMAIGRGRSWADGLAVEQRHDRGRASRPAPLVPRELVVGVRERIDSTGRIVMPLVDANAMQKVQRLVDEGVRGFVVVLLNSFRNPTHEQRIRELIRGQYPSVYLGYMPVFLSSEISPQMGEYRRMMTCILDGYLRIETEDHLISLAEELRDRGYREPFLLAKCTGGASSLSRTRPVEMFGSGPVAGLVGAASVSRECGHNNVIVADMGGTSFDVGLIVDGHERGYEFDPIIDRWRVQVPIVAHWSIGAGGGSLAHVTDGVLQVGPESAKALPGPACYARGGERPTVTDADVVLGFIDPEYFLGGKVKLDATLAEQAVRQFVAEPLGIALDEAAWAIRMLVDGVMGQEMYRLMALRSGLDPREFTMYAFGGAGAVHAAGCAEAADVRRVVTFPFSSVGGAYGALELDLLQTYEATHLVYIAVDSPQGGRLTSADPEPVMRSLNERLEALRVGAERDIAEEALPEERIEFHLECLMRFAQQRYTLPVRAAASTIRSAEDLDVLVNGFVDGYVAAYGAGSAFPDSGLEIVALRLAAVATRPSVGLPDEDRPRSSTAEPTSLRKAYWGPTLGRVETPVFRHEQIPTGVDVDGPALVDAIDTVCVVPPGWSLAVDQRGIAVLTTKGGNDGPTT